MFVLKENNELHPYYGCIQFSSESASHCDMMVSNKKYGNAYFHMFKWMSFKSYELDTLSGLHMVNNKFYEQDRITSPWRFAGRCVLAPAGKGSSFYVIELPR